MFTENDLLQIQQRGSDPLLVAEQIQQFETGFPFLNIRRAAAAGDGILKLETSDVDRYIAAYDQLATKKEIIKFVPASGAASRMFKALFALMSEAESGEVPALSEDLKRFFGQLSDFAFFEELESVLGGSDELKSAISSGEYGGILKSLLTDSGLNYGGLPKGLLTFHSYDTEVRTPLEEHLVEGAQYAKGAEQRVNLHLTVSPEHRERFSEQVAAVVRDYEAKYGVRYEVGFSVQKSSTDTIAVAPDNTPFRDADGKLLFRPGGHGALLENLNDIDADLIFIKNIDNVVPDRIKGDTIRYKKALAGVLLVYQRRLFDYHQKLLDAQDPDQPLVDEILSFIQEDLCVEPPADLGDRAWEAQREYALAKLARPIRVCGMVVNEGEAGGGPFWVVQEDGSVSLQIVESAQIDKEDPAQKSLMQDSTHFNPVDLVCGPRNLKGKKYDLLEFRDPKTGFISNKSKEGRELKALELPGLWNGAMADWNTLFVEVPAITFNPVKTVLDLLRPEHQ